MRADTGKQRLDLCFRGHFIAQNGTSYRREPELVHFTGADDAATEASSAPEAGLP